VHVKSRVSSNSNSISTLFLHDFYGGNFDALSCLYEIEILMQQAENCMRWKFHGEMISKCDLNNSVQL
jgi:hypothetical protein